MSNEHDWRRWKEEVFGSEYMIWHEGLAVEAVQSLTGEKREDAIRMLRMGVEFGDEHACEALAAMGDASAIAEMRAKLRESRGASRVRIARAIHALSPDESLANELVEVLEDPSLFWSEQMNAAIGLRDFGDLGSERALLDAIKHNNEYLVRYHASESLLRRWHVTPSSIREHPLGCSCMKRS